MKSAPLTWRNSLGVLLLTLTSVLAFGQTSSLSGLVVDPQGNAIAGATITVINKVTGASRTTVSSKDGTYQIPQLPPGLYRVRAEAQGFVTLVQEELQILVNTPLTLNLAFTQVGAVTETVTVQGGESAVNTSDATIGNAFSENQIKLLPLEGRNVVGLLSLQPGVVFTGIEGDMRSGSVNGGRSDQANVTLDGVDVNDQQTGAAFTSVLRLTLDSVQEFRVTTTNPNAEQGRSSGAQIGLVTKSGTNEFHGAVYEYHRNTKTTANDFFNNRAGIKRPALLRNVFGAAVGGPIVKNRAFFFLNYEGRRDRSQTSELRIVPSETMKAGQLRFRAVDGTIRTLTPDDLKAIDPLGIGVNQAVLDVLRQYPVGNDPSQGIDQGLNFTGFRFNAPLKLDFNTYIARFDFKLTEDGKHTVFWRGNLQNDDQTAIAPQFPGQEPAAQFLENSKGFVVGYTALLRSDLVNNFRWGLTRRGFEQTGVSGPRWGIRSLDDIRNFGARAFGRKVPVHNLTDDLSWTRGTHNFQFGTNIRFISNDRFTFANSFPAFAVNDGWMKALGRDILPALVQRAGVNFVSAARNPIVRAFMGLLGVTPQKSATYFFDRQGQPLPLGQAQAREFAANEFEFYWQDSWRVKPNLTFTLGLRYSYATPPWEKNGLQVAPTLNIEDFINQRIRNMNLGIPSNQVPLLGFDLAGKENGRIGFFPPDKDNWSPRFAFAYSPDFSTRVLKTIFGDGGKTSIRGGFSLTYDRIGGAFVVSTDLSGAFGLASGVINQSGVLDYTTAERFRGFNALPAPPPAPRGGFPNFPASDTSALGFVVDNTLRTPYSMSFNFSITRELPHNFTIETAYIGRLGRKLLTKVDISAPLIDFRDPASGQTYAQAVRLLEPLINANTPVAQVPRQPFFENIFPALAGSGLTATQSAYQILAANAPSWTDALFFMDVVLGAARFGPNTFFQQQFQSLPAWTNWGASSYHGFNLLVRKRFSAGTQFDFNYTVSKSIDNASTIENAARLTGQIANIFRPRDSFAVSNFDARHQFNANWIAELPFGQGRLVGRSVPGWLNQFIGGWSVTGLFRYQTGLPLSVGNGFFFPTNFFLTGPATKIAPAPTSDVTKKDPNGEPNLFRNPAAVFAAFANTKVGDSGSRNVLRGHRFFTLDLGVQKNFRLPWESHRIQFRWETFNLTNTPNFAGVNLTLDDRVGFGRFTSTTGDSSRRVMQFALRYEF